MHYHAINNNHLIEKTANITVTQQSSIKIADDFKLLRPLTDALSINILGYVLYRMGQKVASTLFLRTFAGLNEFLS